MIIVTQPTAFLAFLPGCVLRQMLRLTIPGTKAPVLRKMLCSLLVGVPPLCPSLPGFGNLCCCRQYRGSLSVWHYPSRREKAMEKGEW